MKFRVEQGVVLGLVLVIVAAVALLVSWSSTEDNIVRELEQEPQVSVYMHETGQIREMPMEEYIAAVVCWGDVSWMAGRSLCSTGYFRPQLYHGLHCSLVE